MISDVAAVVTAVATAVLAALTFALMRATKNLADLTSSPFCVLIFESSPASAVAINQSVLNTGTGTAFDVEVCLTPSLQSVTDVEDVEGWSGISILPPGLKLTSLAGTSPALYDKVFDVEVSWSSQSASRSRQRVAYKCQAVPQATGAWNVKTVHHLVDQIEGLRMDTKAVGDALKKAVRR